MIFMFDTVTSCLPFYFPHRLFIGSVQCLCASCICILWLYSVFSHLLFLFFLVHTSCVFFLCIHACTLCATSSLAIRFEGSIFGGSYIFGGTYLFMRAPNSLLPPCTHPHFALIRWAQATQQICTQMTAIPETPINLGWVRLKWCDIWCLQSQSPAQLGTTSLPLHPRPPATARKISFFAPALRLCQ
jgi:hypothetical protein